MMTPRAVVGSGVGGFDGTIGDCGLRGNRAKHLGRATRENDYAKAFKIHVAHESPAVGSKAAK